MDARLPLNPNLGFYRKSAKELKRAVAHQSQAAAARFIAQHPKYRDRAPAALLAEPVSLSDALLVIAREHGCSSWNEFKRAVQAAAERPEPTLADQLLQAVRAADLAAVSDLCRRHPGLAAQADSTGALPLVEASDRAQLEIARALLDAGADPKRGDPLLAAAHPGPHKQKPALEIVELLIARGVPDDIFVHALLGRVDALRAQLPAVDVNARGPASSTALFLAVWNGQVEAVRLLLEAGAAPNPIGRNGQNAWQVAFQHAWSERHRQVARLLLDHGVTCTLHEACVLSHLDAVKRELARQPELVDAPNEKGLTVLDIAISKADAAIARLLLEAGAADPKSRGRVLVSAEAQRRKNLSRSVFINCSFELVQLHDCSLKDAVLSNVNLSGVTIDNANLSGASIDNAYISGLRIYGIEVEPLLRRELERRAARKKAARDL